ncbi:MAG: hypothetical protein R2824_01805 [Saprospiraceae bacterium]|nr:hypothetical protein [Lewinella sp.]
MNLNLPGSLLPESVNFIGLSGKGLRFFNPREYPDQLLLDGTAVELSNIDYQYAKADSIRLTIPNRNNKKFGIGRVELIANFDGVDEVYHCGNVSLKKSFCYESPLDLIPASGRSGDKIVLKNLNGQFDNPKNFRVFFYSGGARTSANIKEELVDGGTGIELTVPSRSLDSNAPLEEDIQIEIYDGDILVCTATGPSFTYEYTYTAEVIGGQLGQSICSSDCGSDTAQFCFPRGIDVDEASNVYVADTDNKVIWKIPYNEMDGAYELPQLLAGRCRETEPIRCDEGTMNRNGNLLSAYFDAPAYLAVDRSVTGNGNIYITESGQGHHFLVRKIQGSSISTFAGKCNDIRTPLLEVGDTGAKNEVSFNNPQDIAVDSDGNVYVADFDLWGVFKINSSTNEMSYLAQIPFPKGLHLVEGSTGKKLYVTSHVNRSIEMIDLDNDNKLSTLSTDFNKPSGITADPAGNLFIADEGDNQIFRLDTAGTRTLLSIRDKDGQLITFDHPQGLAYDDRHDRLLIVDTDHYVAWGVAIK